MTQALRQAIIDGADNITVAVSAADLRAIVDELYRRISAQARRDARRDDDAAALGRKDAMRILGVSSSTIQRLTDDGRLPCVMVGRRMTFSRADLDEYLKANRKFA